LQEGVTMITEQVIGEITATKPNSDFTGLVHTPWRFISPWSVWLEGTIEGYAPNRNIARGLLAVKMGRLHH